MPALGERGPAIGGLDGADQRRESRDDGGGDEAVGEGWPRAAAI
jgi:hypothetical protein